MGFIKKKDWKKDHFSLFKENSINNIINKDCISCFHIIKERWYNSTSETFSCYDKSTKEKKYSGHNLFKLFLLFIETIKRGWQTYLSKISSKSKNVSQGEEGSQEESFNNDLFTHIEQEERIENSGQESQKEVQVAGEQEINRLRSRLRSLIGKNDIKGLPIDIYMELIIRKESRTQVNNIYDNCYTSIKKVIGYRFWVINKKPDIINFNTEMRKIIQENQDLLKKSNKMRFNKQIYKDKLDLNPYMSIIDNRQLSKICDLYNMNNVCASNLIEITKGYENSVFEKPLPIDFTSVFGYPMAFAKTTNNTIDCQTVFVTEDPYNFYVQPDISGLNEFSNFKIKWPLPKYLLRIHPDELDEIKYRRFPENQDTQDHPLYGQFRELFKDIYMENLKDSTSESFNSRPIESTIRSTTLGLLENKYENNILINDVNPKDIKDPQIDNIIKNNYDVNTLNSFVKPKNKPPKIQQKTNNSQSREDVSEEEEELGENKFDYFDSENESYEEEEENSEIEEIKKGGVVQEEKESSGNEASQEIEIEENYNKKMSNKEEDFLIEDVEEEDNGMNFIDLESDNLEELKDKVAKDRNRFIYKNNQRKDKKKKKLKDLLKNKTKFQLVNEELVKMNKKPLNQSDISSFSSSNVLDYQERITNEIEEEINARLEMYRNTTVNNELSFLNKQIILGIRKIKETYGQEAASIFMIIHKDHMFKQYVKNCRTINGKIDTCIKLINNARVKENLYKSPRPFIPVDLNIGLFGCMITRHLEESQYIYYVSKDHLASLLIDIGSLNSFQKKLGLHANILLYGPAAASKSFLFYLLKEKRNVDTIRFIVYATKRHKVTDENMNGFVFVFEEMPKKYIQEGNKVDPEAESEWKSLLGSSVMTAEIFEIVNGKRVTRRLKSEWMVVILGSMNTAATVMSPAISSRFITKASTGEYNGAPDINVSKAGEEMSSASKKSLRYHTNQFWKMIQSLVCEIECMIEVGALNEVTMAGAMIFLLYVDNYLRKRGYKFPHARVMEQIVLLTRTFTIVYAIFRCFLLPSSEFYNKEEITVENLKNIDPFLFTEVPIAVFVLTLLKDQILDPVDDMIILAIEQFKIEVRKTGKRNFYRTIKKTIEIPNGPALIAPTQQAIEKEPTIENVLDCEEEEDITKYVLMEEEENNNQTFPPININQIKLRNRYNSNNTNTDSNKNYNTDIEENINTITVTKSDPTYESFSIGSSNKSESVRYTINKFAAKLAIHCFNLQKSKRIRTLPPDTAIEKCLWALRERKIDTYEYVLGENGQPEPIKGTRKARPILLVENGIVSILREFLYRKKTGKELIIDSILSFYNHKGQTNQTLITAFTEEHPHIISDFLKVGPGCVPKNNGELFNEEKHNANFYLKLNNFNLESECQGMILGYNSWEKINEEYKNAKKQPGKVIIDCSIDQYTCQLRKKELFIFDNITIYKEPMEVLMNNVDITSLIPRNSKDILTQIDPVKDGEYWFVNKKVVFNSTKKKKKKKRKEHETNEEEECIINIENLDTVKYQTKEDVLKLYDLLKKQIAVDFKVYNKKNINNNEAKKKVLNDYYFNKEKYKIKIEKKGHLIESYLWKELMIPQRVYNRNKKIWEFKMKPMTKEQFKSQRFLSLMNEIHAQFIPGLKQIDYIRDRVKEQNNIEYGCNTTFTEFKNSKGKFSKKKSRELKQSNPELFSSMVYNNQKEQWSPDQNLIDLNSLTHIIAKNKRIRYQNYKKQKKSLSASNTSLGEEEMELLQQVQKRKKRKTKKRPLNRSNSLSSSGGIRKKKNIKKRKLINRGKNNRPKKRLKKTPVIRKKETIKN